MNKTNKQGRNPAKKQIHELLDAPQVDCRILRSGEVLHFPMN
jgi:hypothetical protein